MALVNLSIYADSSKHSLLAATISTEISCTGPTLLHRFRYTHPRLPSGETFLFTPFITVMQCNGMGYAWVIEDVIYIFLA